VNEGGYGQCDVGCVYGPRCGDGEVQTEFGEECDEGDGGNDGGYGQCAPGCVLGPHCGDNVLQPAYEDCDDGNHDAGDGCDPSCQDELWVPE
jgi:cysteine-rich repeat protein